MSKLFLSVALMASLSSYATEIASLNTTPTTESAAVTKPLTKAPIGLEPLMLNKVVAYVNKRIITQNELTTQMAQANLNLRTRGIQNTATTDLRTKVLDQLILQQIQLDLAARGGIKTSDSEVNDAIQTMEKNQGLSDQQMRHKLEQQKLSYAAFRQQINDQITTDKLKQREVDGRVSINEDEVNRILNSEIYKNRVDYRLSDIVISLPEAATAELVQQRQLLADKVASQLQQGQPFDQMAIKYSSAPNALQGGDLGWKSNTSLPPIILNALNKVTSTGISPVIKLPLGFFIFKVSATKQHGTPQIVHQYHVRHILIKVNELTSDDEAHQKVLMIREQLLKDNANPQQQDKDFITLAKQYSEDTSSIKGGDIGWIGKGDTVPAFEQVMIKTPIGQISPALKSPFGWHILEVTETRDSNLANDKEKAEIRQDLRESKAQMLYSEWVRNLREMAYVKINND